MLTSGSRRSAGLAALVVALVAQGAAADPPSAIAPDPVLHEAEALYSGIGGVFDPTAAWPLFEKAAAGGDASASLRLALLLHLGTRGAPKDAARAVELYGEAAVVVAQRAAAGEAYARYLLGTARLVGLGGDADPGSARQLLEQAASAGQVWAMHNLGWMHERGLGVPKDAAAALHWYRRAADAGAVPAMSEAARLLITEDVSGAPCAEGLRWLERAAEAGYRAAVARLGKVLYYGVGQCVRPQPERSRPWLERSAATKEPGASFDLAFALLVGDAGERNPGLAESLLAQAADQQDIIAVELLAFLYSTGTALARDPEQGRVMRERAATLGTDGLPLWMRQVADDARARALFDQGVARLEA